MCACVLQRGISVITYMLMCMYVCMYIYEPMSILNECNRVCMRIAERKPAGEATSV